MSKPRNRPQLQITIDPDLRERLGEWAAGNAATLQAFVEDEQARQVVKLGIGSAIEYVCTRFLGNGVSTTVDTLTEQVRRLQAEREMLIAQRDSLMYDLSRPSDSELSGIIAQLQSEPESIGAFLKRTRCRREYLAWVLSTHIERLDALGVKLGEPHASTRGAMLWLMTGQVISSIWREAPNSSVEGCEQASSDDQADSTEGE